MTALHHLRCQYEPNLRQPVQMSRVWTHSSCAAYLIHRAMGSCKSHRTLARKSIWRSARRQSLQYRPNRPRSLAWLGTGLLLSRRRGHSLCAVGLHGATRSLMAHCTCGCGGAKGGKAESLCVLRLSKIASSVRWRPILCQPPFGLARGLTGA